MPQVILISQYPLPYSKIGSWTTLYNSYLKGNHQLDFVICLKPEIVLQTIKYQFVFENVITKLKKKFLKQRYFGYLKALKKILRSDQQYIIQIIDNFGIIKPLQEFLIQNDLRRNCQIQFFYHGYLPYTQKEIYEIIDEVILLTNDSYKEHKKQINIIPNYFSILPNGIDTQKFCKISDVKKSELKKLLGFNDKKVFVWCSQDRPKKGLDLILNVWKKIYTPQKNILLVVIGTAYKEEMDGVSFLGKILNDELPKYYQASDCYLFPTLCQEGFGLSLIEALHCGNYCIASALGGVPEVLQYGKYGRLIENPHFIPEWEVAINDFLEGKFELPELPNNLYSMESWKIGMDEIIDNAKFRAANN